MPEFAIHALPVGGGTLAISPMPGRGGGYAADFGRLLDWRPALVVSMTPLSELAVPEMPADLAAAGIAWRHFPVVDFGVPDIAVQAAWPTLQSMALAVLALGDCVLFHCQGGCGRSGMAALRLMIAAGEGADAALLRLHAMRPCAVETGAQMDWATGLA